MVVGIVIKLKSQIFTTTQTVSNFWFWVTFELIYRIMQTFGYCTKKTAAVLGYVQILEPNYVPNKEINSWKN